MPNNTECTQLLIDGVVGKGDADISGPGVVIAFVLSAYITLTAIICAYVGGLVDGGLLRPIDRLILRVPSRAAKHNRLHVSLRKLVIALSDQQIITGIAVLAAGFQGLRTGAITVYHFQIVVYLGWSSSSVHLSALTLLRPFLWRHRGMMIWRVIGMAVLMVMLVIALIPTISNDWGIVTVTGDENFWSPQNDFGVPAICFWGELYGDGVNADAIISFVILVVSYIWKMGGLFMPIRHGWQSFVRNPLDSLLERPMVFLAKLCRKREHDFFSRWLFRLYFACWLPIFTILEILGSFSAALWLSILGTIYGTLQILIPREIVQAMDPSIAAQESEFGFGQLIALILLVQPLGAVTEHIWLIGQDDEQVYDPESEDPWAISFGDVKDAELAKRSVFELASELTVRSWQEETPGRIRLKTRLYQSKTFATLVWWTQINIAVIAIVIFTADAATIGWDTTGNYLLIVWACSAWIGSTAILMLIFTPLTSLTRVGGSVNPQDEMPASTSLEHNPITPWSDKPVTSPPSSTGTGLTTYEDR